VFCDVNNYESICFYIDDMWRRCWICMENVGEGRLSQNRIQVISAWQQGRLA